MLPWKASLLAVAPFVLAAQPSPTPATTFTQAFYDWYVPKALSPKAKDTVLMALREKGTCFDPTLLKALQADAQVQKQNPGVIVGLDFDPFLASQDPEERYIVGSVLDMRGSTWVNIHGVSAGGPREKPDLVAELVQHDGQWRFVNFHYSQDSNLLGLLKRLHQDSEKPAR